MGCKTYAILVPKRVKRLSTAVTTGTTPADEEEDEEEEAEEEEEEGEGKAIGPGCNSFHSSACNSHRHVAHRPIFIIASTQEMHCKWPQEVIVAAFSPTPQVISDMHTTHSGSTCLGVLSSVGGCG